MQYTKLQDGYMLSIEKDEKIIKTITDFCLKMNIANAQLSGIGAVKNIEIGAYNLNSKDYKKVFYNSIWELISFQGNIVLKDKIPFLHAHISISNHNMDCKGGHLFEASIAVAGEFFLRHYDTKAYRILNHEIGLPSWCLNKEFLNE